MVEAGYVARIRKGEVHTGFKWGHLKEAELLEDLRVDLGLDLSGLE